MIGAFVGALLVWLMYYLPHWPVTQDANLKLAVFCTGRHPQTSRKLSDRDRCDRRVRVRRAGHRRQRTDIARPGDINLSVVFSNGLQPLLIRGLVLGVGLSSVGRRLRHQPGKEYRGPHPQFLLPIPGEAEFGLGLCMDSDRRSVRRRRIGAQLFRAVRSSLIRGASPLGHPLHALSRAASPAVPPPLNSGATTPKRLPAQGEPPRGSLATLARTLQRATGL